jgi:hypothetical protein
MMMAEKSARIVGGFLTQIHSQGIFQFVRETKIAMKASIKK